MRTKWLSMGLVGVVAALSAACTQATAAPDAERSVTQPILGGSPATGAKYGAVGALVSVFDFGPGLVFHEFHCSGTLIAPHAVLTARHCTAQIDETASWGFQTAFVFRDNVLDGNDSTGVVPIAGYVNAPSSPNHPGLLLNGGRDVAVVYLESAPEGVVPAQLGEFDRSMLGTQFEIAGFGRTEANFSGIRYAGPATARTLEGHWYQRLFEGNRQEYLDWYFTDSVSSHTLDQAKEWWTLYKLEPNYELLAGGLEGEALSCFGDSGGPLLLGNTAEELTVHGVGFAGESSQSSICALGGAYAVMNEEMLDFVRGALP